ncbi:MAG: prepilin-type N-terminal cleavage/methylation domain-containing protein [Planctomycetota bacterium]|nr:prepilin-type N-terminal cleavage/methylation domain-containing protein [Planctomycetota bacterium]
MPIASAHAGVTRRRGFTLVETVLCIVVTGLMLVAALSATAAARVGQYKITERQRGSLLGQELMAEILVKTYGEPDGDLTLGPDTDEGTANRLDFDDVDDYHGWSASPPQNPDGTPLPDHDGWTRAVSVRKVMEANLRVAVGAETGIKVVTVTVSHHGTPVATLTAVRTCSG